MRILILVAAVSSISSCIAPKDITGGVAPSVRKVMEDRPPVPKILVNQTGYLPKRVKYATVRDEGGTPLDWCVLDGSGAKAACGKTRVFGPDRLSGDAVHLIDFSSVRGPGDDFVVQVGAARSHPFAIRDDLYRKLKYDALAYFYHNRSGVPIEMPYAGHSRWTRPAGHLTDRDVPCCAAFPCAYRLDVSGGWYDAGDHGKYVVNGGIAAWTLLAMHERLARFGRSAADFADGKLTIPERGNRVPDLLDEARFEVEFLLKMQIPAGQPLQGMAHHKMHDRSWTELATPPHLDKEPRYLQPPSTAATLNLAAVAAQAARIWKSIDPPFAQRCLDAAARAWAAAQANPKRYAPGGQSAGGGPYDDRDVSDELYWAATELFITTGDASFLKAMEASPHHLVFPSSVDASQKNTSPPTTMTWQVTHGLAAISLLLSDAKLAADGRQKLVAGLRAAADLYAAIEGEQGYRSPVRAGSKGYPWGSNSFVVNNLLVVALAYDVTHDARYLDAVSDGMDYVLGRNPMDMSYVSGWGERPLANPHHRFWAHQYNYHFPPPPPGALGGGPNSGLEDPVARAAKLMGCAPQKCYVDHIEAWSLNEIAINWNAPLAWVAAFLDETAPL